MCDYKAGEASLFLAAECGCHEIRNLLKHFEDNLHLNKLIMAT